MGFVGLGKMGCPMALRLIEAGFALKCYDGDPQRLAPLSQAGAVACAFVADTVQDAEIVITMLPDGDAVRQVMLGEGSASSAMREGAFLADMSSSAPLATRELGRELEALGISMIDAPVSGGVAKASDGSLAIMVGGQPEYVETARPVFEVMGNRIIHAGKLGSGHAVKALNNYVSAAGLVAACEAVLVASAFGVEPEKFVDILNASTGRNNSTELKMKPQILSEKFTSGFALGLMSKDLSAAADLADKLGLPQSGMSSQADLWAAALEMRGNGADHTEIFRFLQNA
ncbi:MAG: NAD(P)-dependent oxidoreductase [Halocynthiibacter sp.]